MPSSYLTRESLKTDKLDEFCCKGSCHIKLASTQSYLQIIFIQISTGALWDIITLEIGLLQEGSEIEKKMQKKHRWMLGHCSFTE
jgi:hypothetical protein